jgi:hypothetical protein
MASTNNTPLQLYYSLTATNTPSAGNLVNGELAINIADGKLYYKDNAGAVQLIASKTTAAGNAITANNIANSGGWSVTPSGTTLFFNYNGTNVAKLDSTGNLTVKAAVVAFGTV